jgi:hypothetical protein
MSAPEVKIVPLMDALQLLFAGTLMLFWMKICSP